MTVVRDEVDDSFDAFDATEAADLLEDVVDAESPDAIDPLEENLSVGESARSSPRLRLKRLRICAFLDDFELLDAFERMLRVLLDDLLCSLGGVGSNRLILLAIFVDLLDVAPQD